MNKELWEILVPTVRNCGKPFRLRYHRVWDAKVKAVSGGLTILTPAKGRWIDPATGDIYNERMIPVRFLATRDEAVEVVKMTCDYYDQLAILCYRISDDVIYYEKDS